MHFKDSISFSEESSDETSILWNVIRKNSHEKKEACETHSTRSKSRTEQTLSFKERRNAEEEPKDVKE
jgi:hypothetical protein